MYSLFMLSEHHTEERVDLVITLKGICRKYPDATASQLADIIVASIDTAKYQVSVYPSTRAVAIHHGHELIARIRHATSINEILNT